MKLPAKLVIGLFILSIIAMIILSFSSPYQQLEDENYIPPSDGSVKTNTRLYYVYDNAIYSEVHRILVKGGDYEQSVLDSLKEGAANVHFKTIFDLGYDVQYVDTINNICYVNLIGENIDRLLNREIKANLYLWSIVNSLTEIKGVMKVQFMYNELPLNYLALGMDFSKPILKVDAFNAASNALLTQTVIEFTNNLKIGRFDIAYNALSSSTQKQVSYVDFLEYAKFLLESLEGYKQTTAFVKVYPNYRTIYLRYEIYSEIGESYVSIYRNWNVKREDNQYKIEINLSEIPKDKSDFIFPLVPD